MGVGKGTDLVLDSAAQVGQMGVLDAILALFVVTIAGMIAFAFRKKLFGNGHNYLSEEKIDSLQRRVRRLEDCKQEHFKDIVQLKADVQYLQKEK